MDLLIVESPTKSKTIVKYLGNGFKVLSSYGHVRGIPSKSGAVHCDDNFKIDYEIQEKSVKHINNILDAAKKAKTIYLATDPDREGEAISWHLAEILIKSDPSTQDKIRRAKFNEITKDAVRKAIDNAGAIDINLVRAQQARQSLDYLVGFTLSPILWKKLPKSKSAGRVQSVALRIICEREMERKLFKSEEHWSVEGDFISPASEEKFQANLVEYKESKIKKLDIKNESSANEIVKDTQKCQYKVLSLEAREVKKSPPPPFTTSTLIQAAANSLGFSASKTAKISQELYEGVAIDGVLTGLITYMRTDSVAISSEAISQTMEMISNHFGDRYMLKSPRRFKNKNRNAQEAHEAIRPTNVSLTPTNISRYLTPEQSKLYGLIWKRLVASQMPDAILKITTVQILATKGGNKEALFQTSGTVLDFDGFYVIYGSKLGEDSAPLPKLSEGENLNCSQIAANQHFTKAPGRYGEATLIKTLEKMGIGRPSTYPAIIATLKGREYVDSEQKNFAPTVKGTVVNSFLCAMFDKYVNYDFTANLEEELDKVADGTRNYIATLEDFWKPFAQRVSEVSEIDRASIMKKIESSLLPLYQTEETKCPKCQNDLRLQYGRYGLFFSCSSYPQCKYIKACNDGEGGDKAALEDMQNSEFPKVIGDHKGNDITLNKGPYGFYLKCDGKSVSLPKNLSPESLEEKTAQILVSMPKKIGKYAEDGEDMVLGCGKFGPYILHNKTYISIKKDDFWNISEEEAAALVTERKNNPVKKRSTSRKAKE